MSAALVAFPLAPGYLAAVSAGQAGPVTGRKQPHRLRLIRACAEPGPVLVEEQAAPPEVVPEAMPVKKQATPLAFYRKHTEAMLRRYMTMSMEAGRVPSLLGRELFRGDVSHYTVHSFEDVVIYVRDVEKCLARLGPGQQHLVKRIAMQGYTQPETSEMLGITLRTVVRRYGESLDRLTSMFLRLGLLERDTLV